MAIATKDNTDTKGSNRYPPKEILMAFLSGLAGQVALPSGFWEFIWSRILLASGSPFALIVNYGLRVIVFTIALKIILSPLDIYQRIRQRKNQQIIEGLKPETEKLEKQFGSNPRMLQAKKNELNKKNGVKMAAGCIPMFVTMIISIWVLMGGLNPISQYQNMIQYLHLYDAFVLAERQAIVDEAKIIVQEDGYSAAFTFYDVNGYELDIDNLTDSNGNSRVFRAVLRPTSYFVVENSDLTDEQNLDAARARRNQIDARIRRISTYAAQRAVYTRYFHGYYNEYGVFVNNPAQDSFLWVRNIWVSDVFWDVPIRDSAAFVGAIGRFSDPAELGLEPPEGMTQAEFNDWFRDEVIGSYDRVMGYLMAHPDNSRNGLLILPILSIIVMIGSQILMRKLQKKSGQGGMPGMGGMGGMGGMMGGGGGGKIMQYAMPVIFGLFSLGFTAAFALYMVVNSMVTIVITLASMGIMKLLDKRKAKEVISDDGVVRYGRKDPNEVQVKQADTRKNRKNKR